MDKIKVKVLPTTDSALDISIFIADITKKTFKEFPNLTKAEAANKIINNLIQSDHSPLEHINFSVEIKGCSRTFLAQIRTHRIGSFTSSSQQLITYSKGSFSMPFEIMAKCVTDKSLFEYEDMERDNELAFAKYLKRIERGVSNDAARYGLPNSFRVDMTITMNARQWIKTLALRQCNLNSLETIYVMGLVREELIKVWAPFELATPGCLTKYGCKENCKCGKPLKYVNETFDMLKGILGEFNSLRQELKNE